MEARHDPVVRPFVPDRELVARAQHAMMDQETPTQRFVRQRWEEASGANRVALAALRDIIPSHREGLSPIARSQLQKALHNIGMAFEALDDVSVDMLGETMHDVLTGKITTMRHLELDLDQA